MSSSSNVEWGPLPLDEIFAWLERYRSTSWNSLALATASAKDHSPILVIGSMEHYLRKFTASGMSGEADVIRAAIGAPAEHHLRCNSRKGDACDCYMRHYVPALAALDALEREIGDLDQAGANVQELWKKAEAERDQLAKQLSRAHEDEAIEREKADQLQVMLAQAVAEIEKSPYASEPWGWGIAYRIDGWRAALPAKEKQ